MNYYVIGSYLVLFTILEYIKRTTSIHSEITRKVAHLLAGGITIYWSSQLDQKTFLSFVGFFLLLFIFLYRFKILSSIHVQYRNSIGEITYIIGLFILGYVLYLSTLFYLGVLILIVSDVFAGIATFLLKHKQKTIVHFIIYFFVTIAITSQFISLEDTLIIAFILSLVEFYSPYGLDNMTIPLSFVAYSLLFLI